MRRLFILDTEATLIARLSNFSSSHMLHWLWAPRLHTTGAMHRVGSQNPTAYPDTSPRSLGCIWVSKQIWGITDIRHMSANGFPAYSYVAPVRPQQRYVHQGNPFAEGFAWLEYLTPDLGCVPASGSTADCTPQVTSIFSLGGRCYHLESICKEW